MIDAVRDIIEREIHSLHDALPEIRKLASSDDYGLKRRVTVISICHKTKMSKKVHIPKQYFLNLNSASFRE